MTASVMLQNVPAVGRKYRRPEHTFQVRFKPFQIQPFCIAPVLPGETMKNLLLQARTVTDPIKNPLVGWWIEYYFFYVKHRDLDNRDLFTEMMLTQGYDISSVYTATAAKYYHYGSNINWLELCMKRIVKEFFRDEGEAWDVATIDGLPAAKVNRMGWWDSATPAASIPVTDVDDTDISGEELDAAMRAYEFMKANALTNMSYEDFLKSYGVRGVDAEEPHKPELLRYVRDWQYPSNTVDPTTGTPTSAVSWVTQERADKDRFFKEPGFIVGLTVARPKVYFSKLRGNAVSMMNDAFSWLPAIMRDDYAVSLKKFAQTAGLIDGVTDANGYWVDVRDLLIHGDQFANFTLTAAGDGSVVALPGGGLSTSAKQYPALTDSEGFFSGTNKTVKTDGIVALSILGTQEDRT